MKRCLLLSAIGWLAFANVASGDSPGPAKSPWQAYPPSCLAYPLPAPSGPSWTKRVTLETDDPNDHHESVNLVFWRTPCSSGKSALLGRLSRDAAFVNKNPMPRFAGLLVSQGANQNHPARVATEPNTVLSFIPVDLAFADSLTFVFENDASASIDYSQAVDVSVNVAENTIAIAVPAYDEMQYPNADESLQIGGSLTGNWYDPAHGGEGAQIEIGESGGNGRFITFAWYTYDKHGVPFWLFGLGGFTAGDRSATVSVAYGSGGGFAGSAPGSTNSPWGTIVVQFPDCHTMHFTFQANAGLPDGVPQGSGTRDWVRLTGINGLACE